MLNQNLLLKTIFLAASLPILMGGNHVSASTIKPVSDSSIKPNLIAQASTHRVRLGDTLWGISRRYGISIGQLVNLNPKLQSRPNLIYVGETLNVRGVAYNPRPQYRPQPKPQPQYRPQTQYRPKPQPQPIVVPPTPKPQPQVAVTPQPKPRRLSTFNLPSERRTLKTSIGANRGGKVCTESQSDRLRTLLPENNFGWTLYDYPQFFWYSPKFEAKSLNEIEVYFMLGEVQRIKDNGKIIEELGEEPLYEAELTQLHKDRAEIVSFTLPPDAEPLEEGKEYEWEVVVNCPSGSNITASGRIKRLSTENEELSSQLENATIEEYPAILAEAGVWYDALQIMTGLMRDNPEDDILQQDWQNVLELIEFKASKELPIQYIEPIYGEQIGQN